MRFHLGAGVAALVAVAGLGYLLGGEKEAAIATGLTALFIAGLWILIRFRRRVPDGHYAEDPV